MVSACALVAALLSSTAAIGQVRPIAQPAPYDSHIPAPRDVPYPGTIRLRVDATDTARGIFLVRQDVPVTAGHLVLFQPAWQPGAHSIQSTTKQVAGLVIRAGGVELAWRRDPANVYAFHVDVPEGVTSLQIEFKYLSPTIRSQGFVMQAPGVMAIEWQLVVLYPAGYFTRGINFDAGVTVPAGFTAKSALKPVSVTDNVVRYETTNLDTLIDSPVLAARYIKTTALSPEIDLVYFTREREDRPPSPEMLQPLQNLAAQTKKMFGAQHFDKYSFLVAGSDWLGPTLEHHRSAEFSLPTDFLYKRISPAQADLPAHEFIHSWNGKYMRGADLWTPDYQTPMRGSLLWVYEGLTQMWGITVAARAGLLDRQDALDNFASAAADLADKPARQWKTVQDSTTDSAAPVRRALPWASYQGSEEFYYQGAMIWLEVDAILRRKSSGKKSLDDFARAFFGGVEGEWDEHTYTAADVNAALNAVVPHDWAGFFHERIERRGPAPLDWIAMGGYRLVFTDTPPPFWTSTEEWRGFSDLSHSVGLSVKPDGALSEVIWDGPAFAAGLTVGTKIVSVGGKPFAPGVLEQAIRAAKGGSNGITLTVEALGQSREVVIRWTKGLRYPRLERATKGPSGLDALLTPLP